MQRLKVFFESGNEGDTPNRGYTIMSYRFG